MNKALRTPKMQIALTVAVAAAIGAAGWFLLVSPQRSKAADLQVQTDAVQGQITVRRAALASQPRIRLDARASDLYRLTKAVPDRTDMSGVIFTLDRLAQGAGVSLQSIAPAQEILGQGYNLQPLNVVVQGRYGDLSTFLNGVRKLVTVRRGKLDAHGRLFSVESVRLTESTGDAKFPVVAATLTINSFVYSGTPLPGTDTTDGATPSTGAVAAGAPNNG